MRQLLVAAAIAAFSLPAFADPFCDTLKAVAADAPNGFAAIRGPLAFHPPDERFLEPLLLPGAQNYSADRSMIVENACSVRRSYSGAFEYTCTFLGGSRRDEESSAVEALVTRAAACLGVATPDLAGRPDARHYAFKADKVYVGTHLFYHPHGGGVLALTLTPDP